MYFRDDPEGLELRGTVAGAQRQVAFRAIHGMILTMRLCGPIFEARLAEEISVPREAIRAALLLLERQGFVVRGDNRAFLTRQVHLQEYLESMAVRGTLEGEATYRAVGHIPPARITAMRWAIETLWTSTASHQTLWRLDEELHALISDHCGNPTMAATIRRLRLAVKLCTSGTYEERFPQERIDASRVEHLEILDALARRDAKTAKKMLVGHVGAMVKHQMTL